MKLKMAGFAIYERGIRVGTRLIEYRDIVSMRAATAESWKMVVQLRNECVLAGHPDMDEQQIADALKLVADRNLIERAKTEELADEPESESSLETLAV